MASNVLAGLGGFLTGGFGAFNNATAREDELSEKDRQFQLQQEQLRRAIANDERIAANADAQLGQQRAQQASLDDQRLFQQSDAVVKSGYKGTLTPDMVAKLHPTHRALAVEELPRGPLDSIPQIGAQNLDGSIDAPPDGDPRFRLRESESERMAIAQLRAQQALAQQGSLDKYRDRKMDQDREIAFAQIMARIAAGNGSGKGSTGAEKKDLQFFNRMLQAERDARGVESDVSNWDLGVNEMAPGFMENWLKSPKGQQYTAAQRSFTEARLRKESGAAINAGEFDTDRRVNFRISGDAPEGFADKRRRRLTTLRGLGFSSGKAFNEYYGPDATLDSVLAEFADKQAAAGGGGGGGTGAPKQPKRIRFDAQGNVIQ